MNDETREGITFSEKMLIIFTGPDLMVLIHYHLSFASSKTFDIISSAFQGEKTVFPKGIFPIVDRRVSVVATIFVPRLVIINYRLRSVPLKNANEFFAKLCWIPNNRIQRS